MKELISRPRVWDEYRVYDNFDDMKQAADAIERLPQPVDMEPVAYQYRCKSDGNNTGWSEWKTCNKEQAGDYQKTPYLHAWFYEVRERFPQECKGKNCHASKDNPTHSKECGAEHNACHLQELEPVAWMSPGRERLEFSRSDTVYGSHTIPIYSAEQVAWLQQERDELQSQVTLLRDALKGVDCEPNGFFRHNLVAEALAATEPKGTP